MKRNELVQIKDLDIKELIEKVKSFRKDLADLVLDKNSSKLKDVKVISKKRKDLAQILTVIRQKQLLVELESKAAKKGTK